jgi:iron complex outermembrane recepter protein
MTVRSVLLPAVVSSGVLLCTAALAPAQAVSDPVLLGEAIEVLATREPASPATATTIPLEAQPLGTTAAVPGLAAQTAGFFVGDNGGRSFTDTFALRGLVNTPLFGEPAVTVYLDGIPLGSGFTTPTELTGFTTAELHRGPSAATTFGRAGPGGVLALLTPAASLSPGGAITVGFGNHDTRVAQVSAHSSAEGPVDVYVAAGYRARDGFITNTRLGQDVDYRDGRSALARFRVRPSETAELTLLVTGLRARDGAQPLVPLGSYFEVDRSGEGETSVDSLHAGLTAAFATPIGRLAATTAVTDWELGPYSNTLSFGFADLQNRSTLRQRIWSEEIVLSSVGDTESKAAAGQLDWRVGVFGADNITEGAFVRAFSGFTFEESAYRIDTVSLAAFGQARFHPTDVVTLSAGLRVESTRRDFVRDEVIPNPSRFTSRHESSALLPHLAVDYALDSATTLFGRIGAGYKPGGFSAFTGNPNLTRFGAERTQSLEAGITRAPVEGRIETTLRLYAYNIDGYQIERSFATGAEADDYLVVNAGRARSLGGELELAWRPVDGWRIAADLGVTHVTLRDFRDPYTGTVHDGQRAPYVPVYDASVRVDYQHSSGWFAGVNATANGRTYYTEDENLMFGQRSYGLLGARAGWDNNRFRVAISGANLTDEEYYSAITPGAFHGAPGAPRTWLVEAAVRF